MSRLRPEITAAVRLAALLGLVGALGPFLLVVLKAQIWMLVLPTGSMETAWGLAAGFAVAACAVVALAHLRDVALIALGNRLARRLALPALLAAAERPGVDPALATQQALHDVEELRRGIAGPVCTFALDAVLVPALLLMLSVFHWAFAVFGLAAALVALVLGVMAERMTRRTLAEANRAGVRGARLVADSVRCAEAVEAHGMLPALVRRWAGALALGAAQLRAAQSGARLASAATTTLYGLATSGALVVGATLALNGVNIGFGIVAGVLLTARLMEPFGHLSGSLGDLASARAAWARLDALLGAANAAPPRESRAYPCLEGCLAVERVTLVHPGGGRPLLREVTLDLAPGQVVALAGPPGAGKSTLLRLILGVEVPTAGGVFLDGHATAQWDREDLARHIGYLPQDPAMPAATVAEAIARLDPAPDMAEVLRAARLAGADRMIASLPDGYATRLDGPVRLSMGQRQRIALARAVYGVPRILLLDEPAAYLDAEGEAAVARMIATVSTAGTAVLFTSHREALLQEAGRTLTLKSGAWALRGPSADAPARIAGPSHAIRTKLPAPAMRIGQGDAA
jgi:ATP-binding cassette subfamily C protein